METEAEIKLGPTELPSWDFDHLTEVAKKRIIRAAKKSLGFSSNKERREKRAERLAEEIADWIRRVILGIRDKQDSVELSTRSQAYLLNKVTGGVKQALEEQSLKSGKVSAWGGELVTRRTPGGRIESLGNREAHLSELIFQFESIVTQAVMKTPELHEQHDLVLSKILEKVGLDAR